MTLSYAIHDWQAVLCDFDGTLAPNLDLPQMRNDVIQLTQTYTVPPSVYADHYIVEIINASFAWLKQNNPSQAHRYFRQAHALITAIELDAAQHTEPFPGVLDLLTHWRNQGLALGVVTRNCRAAVLNVFPELLSFVDCLIARDDAIHLKPDPRHLQQCLEHLGSHPTRAAMVGDGALDMHVGLQLDMYCVGVLTGSSDRQRLEQAGAHLVVEHITELAS